MRRKDYSKETYRTIWGMYSKDRWGWKKKLKVSKYVKFLEAVMSEINYEIIVNQYRYKMPMNMGEIYISKKPCHNKFVDYAETKKKGKTTFHDTRWLNGIYPFFKWDKKT